MRRLYIIVFLFITVILLTGCQAGKAGVDKHQSAMPEKIIVQAPVGPPTAPLFKMAQDGLPSGTNLELIIYKSVEEATTRVVKGEADFTVLPVNVAAKLYNKQVDISLADVSTWGVLYLLSADEKVNDWKDLKGKELYTGAQGSSPDILSQYLIGRSGLQKGDIKLTYLGSPEIAQLMINGLIKNAVLPEPMVTQVLKGTGGVRIVRDFYTDWQRFEGELARLPQAGTVVRNDFARSYPQALAEYRETYAEALQWTTTNPEEAAPLVEANLGIKAAVFVKSMERTRLEFVSGAATAIDVNTYLARLLDFSPEMVGGKLPDEKFYLAD